MRTLIIEATSPESAAGFVQALSGFDATPVEADDGKVVVRVSIRSGDREIVDLLNALEHHVTRRAAGPARVELDGRRYTMHESPDRP